MPNTLERVKRIVDEHLGSARGPISERSRFAEDLGADSLDTVELAMAFEDAFGVEISDAKARQLLTVGEAVAYIDSLPRITRKPKRTRLRRRA
ncbi:MAG: acyl carrier protein [Reyranella sp.]|uniref:acyl carrier protein n=1 Tax=Reyranella sp. TaxID=1929291 RepID=UPI00121A3EFB|nr:acyl carrier protein [Reyranella sp.]TAJ42679.1 MAG: acyl carrier protein [Reyranella sp.]